MSTRCTIRVEGVNSAKIYKHYDGYPEKMLEPLKKWNKDFEQKRSGDPELKIAQLLRQSGDLFNDDDPYNGWALVDIDDDMDAEYEYILYEDRVECTELM